MNQRVVVVVAIIVLGVLGIALFDAWRGEAGGAVAVPEDPGAETSVGVPDHALSPVVQVVRTEALAPEGLRGESDEIRVKVCSQDGQALGGVAVYARRGNARIYSASVAPIGVTGSDGCCVINAADCQAAESLAFHHDQHTPLRVASGRFTPGVMCTVFLQPSHEYRIRVVDPDGAAVAGARIRVSRKSVSTSRGWLTTEEGVPGANPETALFTATSDEDGWAVLRGLQADCKYLFHVHADGMFALAGLEDAIEVPQEAPRVVCMGYVYGAVVEVEGDEVVSAHEIYARDFHAPVVDFYLLRPLREDLERRFPQAICLVGVPALELQRDGVGCEFTLALYGRTSGWVTRRMSWHRLDRLVTSRLSLPRGEADMAGRIVCRIETPSGTMRTEAVVAGLMYSGANRAQAHVVKVRGDGEELVLPAGDYAIAAVNPFIEFAEEAVSVGPAGVVELVGSCRRDMVCATIRVEVAPGEWASAFSMEIMDEAQGIAWRGRDLQDGVRTLLPKSVPLRLNYGVPGWSPKTAMVTLQTEHPDISVSVSR